MTAPDPAAEALAKIIEKGMSAWLDYENTYDIPGAIEETATTILAAIRAGQVPGVAEIKEQLVTTRTTWYAPQEHS